MKVCDFSCFVDFSNSLIVSLLIGILYDFIKCLGIRNRRISDFIFTLLAFVLVVFSWVFCLGGILRWYVILTLFLGFTIYFLTISRFVCLFLSFLTKKIAKIFNFIFKFLLTAMRFSGKIFVCIGRCRLFKMINRGNDYEKDKI